MVLLTTPLDESTLQAHGDPACVQVLLQYAPELPAAAGPLGLRALGEAALAAAPTVELPTGVTVSQLTEPQLRLFEPAGRTGSTAVLWMHGGGLIAGTPLQDELRCAQLAVDHAVLVAAASYRLAPEHPYPAALDDCMAALRTVLDRPDVDRVVVAGASAGGGLALALALRAREQGISLAGLVLHYPMLDDRPGNASMERVAVTRLWHADLNRLAWRAYLGETAGTPDVDHLAAPARAGVDQLRGLPPVLIDVGTLDGFFDEDLALADRLARADVPVELVVTPGAFHASELVAPHAVTSRRILRARRSGLQRLLEP